MAASTLLAPATRSSAPTPARSTTSRKAWLPDGWGVYVLFYGYPLWWFLGLQAFIWPIVALPLLFHLIRRRHLVAPRGFGIYLLFLAWMVVSALQLDSGKRVLSFSYRGVMYASAAVLLLYVTNLDRERFPTRRLVYALAFFWFVVVLGGFAGILLPNVKFASPLELLLPAAVVKNAFIGSLVHLSFADTSNLLGYSLSRPKAPFNYTNEWGSNLAILTPFAIYALAFIRRRVWRLALIGTLVLSLAPVILSINRGLWVSLIFGVVYVAGRLVVRGNVKVLAATLFMVVVGAATIFFTPLGNVVTDRLAHPNTEGRAYLYQEATDSALESPVLGHGAPLPSDEAGIAKGASVGTHGQLWTLLVSQGFPGVVLFVGFFVFVFLLTWRVSWWGLWPHAAILIALSQLAVYNWLPVQIHVVMVAAAIAWRDAAHRRDTAEAAADAPAPPAKLRPSRRPLLVQ